jgi:Ni/Co efflux regulator RcnB
MKAIIAKAPTALWLAVGPLVRSTQNSQNPLKRQRRSACSAVSALIVVLAVAGPLALSAPAAAQTDFSGRWMLDKDLSADLTKATFVPARVQTTRSPGGFSGGGFGGRGGFGGGRRTGNNDSRASGGSTVTPEERALLTEFADYVRTLTAITIEHTDHSTFTVTDAKGGARLFPTDGTKTPMALATRSVDSVTKWDGPHMVTVFTIGPAEDLVFTYILVPATKQMALRIRMDESGRQRADVPELRLVYRLTH